jgi:hypothetical protein
LGFSGFPRGKVVITKPSVSHPCWFHGVALRRGSLRLARVEREGVRRGRGEQAWNIVAWQRCVVRVVKETAKHTGLLGRGQQGVGQVIIEARPSRRRQRRRRKFDIANNVADSRGNTVDVAGGRSGGAGGGRRRRAHRMVGGSAEHEAGRNVFYTRVAIVMLTSWRRWLKHRGTNAFEPPTAHTTPTPPTHVAAAIGQHLPRRLTTLTYGSFGGIATTRHDDVLTSGVVGRLASTAMRCNGLRLHGLDAGRIGSSWSRSEAGRRTNVRGQGQLRRQFVADHTKGRAAQEARVADELGRGLEGGDVSFNIERIILHNLFTDLM